MHQEQAQVIKEAFDVAEDMMKQCRIARFRYEKNRTSVNQKRLEVLSVRSVRVVLGSIEKVNGVCQLLKRNYTDLHIQGGSRVDGSIQEGPMTEVGPDHPSASSNRAQSAPTRRADSKYNRSSRPHSAFAARGRQNTNLYKKYAMSLKSSEPSSDEAQGYTDHEENKPRASRRINKKKKSLLSKSSNRGVCEYCGDRINGQGSVTLRCVDYSLMY